MQSLQSLLWHQNPKRQTESERGKEEAGGGGRGAGGSSASGAVRAARPLWMERLWGASSAEDAAWTRGLIAGAGAAAALWALWAAASGPGGEGLTGRPGALRALLGLVQNPWHPEAGAGPYRETWRSGAPPMGTCGRTDARGRTVRMARGTGGAEEERNALTSRLLLAEEGSPLWWGRHASEAVHFWHGGGAFEFLVAHPGGRLERQILGPQLRRGEQLQLAVPGGAWRAGRVCRGGYCLLGEALGPGFDPRDFEVGDAAALRRALPEALWENAASLLAPGPPPGNSM